MMSKIADNNTNEENTMNINNTNEENAMTNTTNEVVRPGSRLAQIARRHYNEVEFWIFIYEANMDKIADPSNLPVGLEIIIPNLDERCPGMDKAQKLEEAKKLKQQLLKK